MDVDTKLDGVQNILNKRGEGEMKGRGENFTPILTTPLQNMTNLNALNSMSLGVSMEINRIYNISFHSYIYIYIFRGGFT